MTNSPKRPAPICFRLSPEKRERLFRDSAGMSVSAYIDWRLFDPENPPQRRRGQRPVKDHQALAGLLGQLGRLASNINQIAKAANSGLLFLTPEVEADIRGALRDIVTMRHLLIAALGLAEDAP